MNTCHVFEQNDDRWESLPPLPNPLCSETKIFFQIWVMIIESLFFSGPAVTLDENDSLYVFGGYDLMSGHVEFRNDFLQLQDLERSKS